MSVVEKTRNDSVGPLLRKMKINTKRNDTKAKNTSLGEREFQYYLIFICLCQFGNYLLW